MRDMPTEPLGLELDTEQLGALEVYKGKLMEPLGKNKKGISLAYIIMA